MSSLESPMMRPGEVTNGSAASARPHATWAVILRVRSRRPEPRAPGPAPAAPREVSVAWRAMCRLPRYGHRGDGPGQIGAYRARGDGGHARTRKALGQLRLGGGHDGHPGRYAAYAPRAGRGAAWSLLPTDYVVNCGEGPIRAKHGGCAGYQGGRSCH